MAAGLGARRPGRRDYADADRIRAIDHHGEFFDVAGPLPTPGGPQGRPLLVQAGGSEGGLGLAGRWADAVFSVAQTQAKAIAFREDLRLRAADAGRGAEAVKVSVGVTLVVGESTAEAHERAEALLDTMPTERLAAGLVAALDLPPGRFGLDDPIALTDLPDEPSDEVRSAGFQASTRALLAEGARSLRELVRLSAGGSGHRLLVGSPQDIADDLIDWWRSGAADGFTTMSADSSVDFERFARLVVPILVERGAFAPASAGTTLRQRLGLNVAQPV